MALCVGNICRSPIAEGLLAREFPDKKVWSAGLSAVDGDRAEPFAVEVAAARGLDISAHRARRLAGWMCTQAELILVMEAGHKALLEREYPMVRGRVFMLAKADIEDPYQKPKEAFETAYLAIEQGVAGWAGQIRRLG